MVDFDSSAKIQNRIRQLQEQIDDLKRRWPAHTTSPALMNQLDELESQLEQELQKLHFQSKTDQENGSGRTILKTLLNELSPGKVLSVTVGLFWTAVVVETEGGVSCGLAATLSNPELEHAEKPPVDLAGRLEEINLSQLGDLIRSPSWLEVSIGLAAINALLPKPTLNKQMPAEEFIASQGKKNRVAVIGHFPFIEKLSSQVAELWVLELKPRENDLPADQAPLIIPQADILAVTATTLINGTFGGIISLRKPNAKVLLLGPSTPLSPRLFDFGIDALSGSIVKDVESVYRLVQQGATFRQIKKAGVELVTLVRPNSY